MFYPHRDDYKCPDCETGTMKWQGEIFASTYVLGMMYCDNPDCMNHRDNYFNFDKMKAQLKSNRGLPEEKR